jgi:hypothetical protein
MHYPEASSNIKPSLQLVQLIGDYEQVKHDEAQS